MAGTFHLRFLGPVQIERDGTPVRGFRSRKALALLGYLAVQDRPVPREHLVDLFWENKPESQGRANLSWVLNRITTLLPGCLQTDRHTVQFLRTDSCWLDIDTFQALEEQGEANSLETAVELYRGEFLEGLYLEGCAEFEIWLVGEREQWRQRVVWALGELVTYQYQCGDYDQAIRFARQLLVLEPWREETHRQVMRLLAWSGQRSAALAQYETCCTLLEEQLGVEPSEETQEIYDLLLKEKPLPDLATPSLLPTCKHNLPIHLTPFVGREVELTELARLLTDCDVRLLTILGAGGIGKTHLALEAGEAQLGNFEGGVFFVSLAPLRSVDAIVPAVAGAIGFSFYAGGDPRQQLLDYLRQKNMLLIMDNFEHLLDGVDLVSAILKTASHVKILATSRARLNVGGEHRFQIVGLECPDWETAEDAADATDRTEHSAVKLFLQGARRARPDFELEVDDFKCVSRICRLVQGMPLGILLAAAWVEILTPEEIAAEIGQSLDFLKTDLRDIPERQRSIRAVFDHSFNLLTEREREVFQALSVFRGGFTQEAAQRVTGASLRELMALVNRSLLHRTPTGRYEIHELLRQYAERKLELSPAVNQAARDQHSVYYTAALQRWNVEFGGPRQQAFLIMAEADVENVRAAWDWAVEQVQVERLDQALEGLEDLYWSCGCYQEGEAALRMAADRLLSSATLDVGMGETSEYRLRVLARILAWEGNFCRLLGHRDRASELQQQGLTILERNELADQDTRREKALIFWLMGHDALTNSPKQGQYLYEQSLALCRELDDRPGTARALISLGTANVFLGALDEARARHEEALGLYQALDDPRCTVRALASLAEIALFQGRLDDADRLAQQSVRRCEELGNQPESAFALLIWGETLEARGQFSKAQSALERSLVIYDDLGHYNYIASVQAQRGSVNLHLGRYEKARTHAQLALDLAHEYGPLFRVGFALAVLGCVALVQKASHRARRLLQDSVSIYHRIGPRSGAGLGWTHAILGYAAHELEDRDRARQHVYEALQTGTKTGMIEPLLWALPGLALLMAKKGEAEQAVELWALASSYPVVANSRWFEDVAGRHIAAVAATLPSEVVAAAQERGRARDLGATVAELLAELGA